MTYNPNIPQSTDFISASQPEILENFIQLNTQFGVDHQAYWTGSANGDGHHKQVTFDNSVSPSAPGGTQSIAYPHLVTNQEFFFQNASKAVQVTNTVLNNTSGEGFMPGGLQMRVGTGTFSGGGPGTSSVNFSSAFPSTCLVVCATGRDTPSTEANAVNCTSISRTGFTANRNSGVGAIFNYIAIGY